MKFFLIPVEGTVAQEPPHPCSALGLLPWLLPLACFLGRVCAISLGEIAEMISMISMEDSNQEERQLGGVAAGA